MPRKENPWAGRTRGSPGRATASAPSRRGRMVPRRPLAPPLGVPTLLQRGALGFEQRAVAGDPSRSVRVGQHAPHLVPRRAALGRWLAPGPALVSVLSLLHTFS